MKLLFKMAFGKSKHYTLLFLTILGMILLTVASQLEIFTLGVITKKGPAFFELFGPIEDGVLRVGDQVTKLQLEERWNQLALNNPDLVSEKDVTSFLEKVKKRDLISRASTWIDQRIPLHHDLKLLAYFIALVAIFKAVTLFFHRFTVRLVAIRVSSDLRLNYMEHLQTLPMHFYQNYNIGTLASRVVGDSNAIAEAINSSLTNYLQTPFVVLTTLILCFLTSWKLSLIIFLGFPLIVFPIVFLAKRVKKVSKQIQHNQERFTSILIDFLTGIQTIKVFLMEEFSLNKYREVNQKMTALEEKGARYDLSSRPIVHTIGMVFLATALLYGLYVEQMSVAAILFYCGLLYLFYEPIKKFAEENSHVQRGIAAAERMFEVMAIQPSIQDAPDALVLREFHEKIEFDRVSFRYGEQWVLQDLSFEVRKGEKVAIVGPTGAGKSTIVQLIPRLYESQKGEIRIDGKPLQAYTQKSIRQQIGFVPQRPFLFLDSVEANIAYGESFSQEQIKAAACKAHADEFIVQLPEGYKTQLADAGKNLSGGQQQRLAIARALVKGAPILIMDEATSSLDVVSEHHIKSAMHHLRGEVTQVVIAHRLSTIEDADKIIYIEKGRKLAEGTREELLAICPEFRYMWETMHRHAK